MTRTALLVRCTAEEANRIRFEARREHCTISAYVLRVSLRTVAADEPPFSELADYRSQILTRQSPIVPGKRTAILVRCDAGEAERIRIVARRRETRINAFILQTLRSTWNQEVPLHVAAVEAPEAAAHH